MCLCAISCMWNCTRKYFPSTSIVTVNNVLIRAVLGSRSYAIKKKDELERVAKANR